MNNEQQIQDKKEIWKDVPGYERRYKISNLGRVKSVDRIVKDEQKNRQRLYKGKILSAGLSGNNYYSVSLCKNGRCRTFCVHQLVAMAFLNYNLAERGVVVNHIDMNKLNNNLKNLEIISHRKNCYFKTKDSTSKYVGVFWNRTKKTWNAQIYVGEKCIRLGSYNNEYDAHLAYESNLKELKNNE